MASPIATTSTTLHVPALRGDGVNVGVVGTAEDGWAVSGESKKQVGVRGWCDDGWGVSGDSKTQVGVRGNCDPGWGVAGESKTGLGVRGFCVSGAGVFGDSTTAPGVEGNSTSSTGVFGHSKTGIGVHGKGGRLAGFFEGNVEVTDNLTVRGVSLQISLQRIQQLEQQVAQIQQRLAGASSDQATSTPQITVMREGTGQAASFTFQGTGFLPSRLVTVRVVDDQLSTLNFQQNADAGGKFTFRQAIACISGKALHISATDSRPNANDPTGVLWSNTFTTTCP